MGQTMRYSWDSVWELSWDPSSIDQSVTIDPTVYLAKNDEWRMKASESHDTNPGSERKQRPYYGTGSRWEKKNEYANLFEPKTKWAW